MALTPQQIQQSNQQFGNIYNSLPGGQQQPQQNGMPAYLQGTQTGAGLFGQDPAASGLQSSIPSINGQNNYIPGQGMPLYGAPQQQAGQYAMLPSGGYTSGISNDLINASRARAAQSAIPSVGGTLSTVPGGTPGATPVAVGIPASGIPSTGTGGQAGGWMSPEQLRAQTTSLKDYVSPNSTGGGGGGGMALGSGANNKATAGGGAAGTGGNSGGGGQNGTPSDINTSSGQFPNNPVISYASPSTDTSMGAQSGSGALQMQQQSPQDALAGYMNTPGYQLLMTNQQNQFQQSPGYQYAVNEAMRNVQNNASARGLLESGSVLRDMTDRAQGMASQGYNDWWNKQNAAFSDYQNRLAGLAGGNVGGDQAYNLGQGLGANTTAAGNDVAGLFGNQGAAGYGGMINTGAAQSGNTTNAGVQQAQVQGTNASTQLAGAVYNRGLF